MRNSPLKEIEIINFKCFERLRLEGMQQVNLIGGKNNLGKTAFMEAVELFVSSSEAYDLFYAVRKMLDRRQKGIRTRHIELDFINSFASKVEILSGNNFSSIEYVEEPHQLTLFDFPEVDSLLKNNSLLRFEVDQNEKTIPIRAISSNRPTMIDREYGELSTRSNFISPAVTEERDLAIFYGALVDLNKEFFLNESLQLFDENIISLKQRVLKRDVIEVSEKQKFRGIKVNHN